MTTLFGIRKYQVVHAGGEWTAYAKTPAEAAEKFRERFPNVAEFEVEECQSGSVL